MHVRALGEVRARSFRTEVLQDDASVMGIADDAPTGLKEDGWRNCLTIRWLAVVPPAPGCGSCERRERRRDTCWPDLRQPGPAPTNSRPWSSPAARPGLPSSMRPKWLGRGCGPARRPG